MRARPAPPSPLPEETALSPRGCRREDPESRPPRERQRPALESALPPSFRPVSKRPPTPLYPALERRGGRTTCPPPRKRAGVWRGGAPPPPRTAATPPTRRP